MPGEPNINKHQNECGCERKKTLTVGKSAGVEQLNVSDLILRTL